MTYDPCACPVCKHSPHQDDCSFGMLEVQLKEQRERANRLQFSVESLSASVLSAEQQVEALRGTLQEIADWKLPKGYEDAWGSMGVRDFMRSKAQQALATPPQEPACGIEIDQYGTTCAYPKAGGRCTKHAQKAQEPALAPKFIWKCIKCGMRVQTYFDYSINQRPNCVQCNAEMEPYYPASEAQESARCPTCNSAKREWVGLGDYPKSMALCKNKWHKVLDKP